MFYNIFPTRIDRAEVVGKKADGQTNQEEINSATTVAYQSIVGSNNVQQSLQQTLLLKEETKYEWMKLKEKIEQILEVLIQLLSHHHRIFLDSSGNNWTESFSKASLKFPLLWFLLNVLVIEQQQQARNQRERYDPYHIFQIDYE
ncbi:hypothetical protein GQX74_013458 [Glossina fuscipes]|nr:hypothetical protein GQX74_013458 [Glossina fuscipes]